MLLGGTAAHRFVDGDDFAGLAVQEARPELVAPCGWQPVRIVRSGCRPFVSTTHQASCMRRNAADGCKRSRCRKTVQLAGLLPAEAAHE